MSWHDENNVNAERHITLLIIQQTDLKTKKRKIMLFEIDYYARHDSISFDINKKQKYNLKERTILEFL